MAGETIRKKRRRNSRPKPFRLKREEKKEVFLSTYSILHVQRVSKQTGTWGYNLRTVEAISS